MTLYRCNHSKDGFYKAFCKEDLSGFKRLGAGLINGLSLEGMYDRRVLEGLLGDVFPM